MSGWQCRAVSLRDACDGLGPALTLPPDERSAAEARSPPTRRPWAFGFGARLTVGSACMLGLTAGVGRTDLACAETVIGTQPSPGMCYQRCCRAGSDFGSSRLADL